MSSYVLDIFVILKDMDFNAREKSEILWTLSPDITSELDLFLQEIDILFAISSNTVLGNRSLGLSIEHLLWSTEYSHDFVSSRIHEQIVKNCFVIVYFRIKISFFSKSPCKILLPCKLLLICFKVGFYPLSITNINKFLYYKQFYLQ